MGDYRDKRLHRPRLTVDERHPIEKAAIAVCRGIYGRDAGECACASSPISKPVCDAMLGRAITVLLAWGVDPGVLP